MNASLELQSAIDSLIEGEESSKVRSHVTEICKRYMYDSGQGKKLVETKEETAAYAVSRMPATYCSVYSALMYMTQLYPKDMKTLLDLGSGTGAVCWAANDIFNLEHITCVERERNMIETAQELMQYNHKITWIQASAAAKLELPQADLVTASYIMNELSENEKNMFLNNLWNHSQDVIIIIEPGTSVGYHNILQARDYFLKQGAYIIAPCCNSSECIMEPNTWCHFACRVERSKLQKYVKGGAAPFEDERYSYIIVTKSKIEQKDTQRILFPPMIHKGFAELTACTAEGIQRIKITSRNKEAYKAVRKAAWGDCICL